MEFFLTGLFMGIGPCSAFCLPILIPYIAGTKEGLYEGAKATLAFSISRLSAYAVLGLLAGLSGEALTGLFLETSVSLYISLGGGALLLLLGLLILLDSGHRAGTYSFLFKHAIHDDFKSMALMGFIVGVKPCGPLLGILIYIAFSVRNPLLGLLYGASFGFGASIITPIVALGVFSGLVPRLIFKTPLVYRAFKKGCGLLLSLFGVRLIASQVYLGG